jgi:hypothetical protein
MGTSAQNVRAAPTMGAAAVRRGGPPGGGGGVWKKLRRGVFDTRAD